MGFGKRFSLCELTEARGFLLCFEETALNSSEGTEQGPCGLAKASFEFYCFWGWLTVG